MADAPGSVPSLDFILRAFTEKAEQDITTSAEKMGEAVGKSSAKMQQDLQKTEAQFKSTAAAAQQAAATTSTAMAQPAKAVTSTPVVAPVTPTRHRDAAGLQPLTDSQLMAKRPPVDPNGPIRFNPDQVITPKKTTGGLVWDDSAKKWIDPAKPNDPLPLAKQTTPSTSLSSSADATTSSTDDTDTASDGTRRTRMRLLGAGLVAAGTYGVRKTNELLANTQETRSASTRMDAMLTKQGDGGSVESMQSMSSDLAQRSAMASTVAIKDAVSQLSGFGLEAQKIEEVMPGLIGYSRVYGKELGSISDAAAEAFHTGDLKGLEDLGVKITDAQREAVGEAETQAEKQKAIYEILKGSFSSYSDSLTAGMTKTEINANRTALAMNELQSNMATGAEKVDAFAKGLGVSLLEMAMPSKAVQETAGAVQSLGSYAVSTTGGVITLLGGIADAKDGMDALGISTKGIGPAVGIARTALGALVPFFSVILPVALAAGMALMLKAAADAKFEKEEDYHNKTQPKENMPSASTSSGALAQAEEMDRLANETAKGIEVRKDEKKVSWPINIFTGKTPAQYDEEIANMEEERQGYAKRAAELRSRANTLPNTAVTTPVTGMPTVSVGGSDTSYADPAAASSISLRPQIDAIQDKIRNSKSKREKEELREELIRLQRAERDRKAAESSAQRAASKAQRSQERAADYASSVASANAESVGGLAMMRLDAKDKIAQNRNKVALESQIKNIDQQKELGLIDDDAAENQIERLKHAYAVRNAAMEKDALMRKAQIEAQAELAAAQAEASTQEASQAKATLDKARIKSNAILEKAKIEASVIGSDIAPLENKKSKSEMLLAHLQGGGSLANLNKNGMSLGVGTYNGAGRSLFGGNSGAMVNPYAGANYGSGLDAFSSMINGGSAFDQAYSTSPGDAWRKRGKGGRGKHTVELGDENFGQEQRQDGGIDLILKGKISLPVDTFMDALGAID